MAGAEHPAIPVEEQPLDPERPIIDPHLHLWDIIPGGAVMNKGGRFLFDELRHAVDASGHNITHSVFVECRQMYRADGPEELRSLGETEFANGFAAMSASGNYGPRRISHRIVGQADLRLGERVRSVLEAHVAVAGERFRGVRPHTAYSEYGMFTAPPPEERKGAMLEHDFQEGARVLGDMDLSLDIWCLHPQLGELIALADAVPETLIVLDHMGTLETQGRYAGQRDEAFTEWHTAITELARRPNVRVKLGGVGMDLAKPGGIDKAFAPSATIAEANRPMIESCIEAFGIHRCMFESNFPPDNDAGSYGAVWNAFKIIAAGCSEEEKDRLFRGTAADTYRIAA